MIKLKSILFETMLTEDQIKKISLQYAIDNNLFGPIFHGTHEKNRDLIDKEGFKIFYGTERSGNISHGYESYDYWNGYPPPIHHLGFGVYFTEFTNTAKKFNYGTLKGLKPYFLSISSDKIRKTSINFASSEKMMKWWIKNGYNYKKTPETSFNNEKTNFKAIKEERLRATYHMTAILKSRYDALLFRGLAYGTTLDGNQICVYNSSVILEMDKSLIEPGEIGSKVKLKVGYNGIPINTTGIIRKKIKVRDWLNGLSDEIVASHKKRIGDSEYLYDITFSKGGTQSQVPSMYVDLVIPKNLTTNPQLELPF